LNSNTTFPDNLAFSNQRRTNIFVIEGLGRLDIDGRIILKLILQIELGEHRLDTSGLG
jgi:hypothetical protein